MTFFISKNMATIHQNLSNYNPENTPSANNMKIGIVVAEWNKDITFNLAKGAIDTLLDLGITESDIRLHYVPGSFELPLGAKWLLESYELDAVITVGCVIQGETKHFDFVCHGVTQGVTNLNLEYSKPVVFCVLTDNTKEQSIARSGGIHGNKGVEAAVTAVKMIDLKRQLS